MNGPVIDESPCESPIEEDFAYHAPKYLADGVQLGKQVEVDTSAGRFRLDFLITAGERRIAVECDGRDYHDFARDVARDERILAEGHVDAIVRLPGRAVYWHIEDCLRVLSIWEPTLFSPRGQRNLETLTSDSLRECLEWIRPGYAQIRYFNPEDKHAPPCDVFLQRSLRKTAGK